MKVNVWIRLGVELRVVANEALTERHDRIYCRNDTQEIMEGGARFGNSNKRCNIGVWSHWRTEEMWRTYRL